MGIYRTAWKSVELIAQGTIMPFSTVSLPTLAKLQSDPAAFRNAYLRIVAVSAAISFPCIVGFGLLADQLIPLIYGAQWEPSVPVAQVLTFLVVPYALNFFADPALTAIGRADVIFRLALVQLAGTVVFCSLAAPFGLTAVAMAYVVRSYLTLALQLWLFNRATSVRPLVVLRAIAPPVAAVATMAVAVLLLGLAKSQFANAWVFVVCAALLGAAVYGLALGLMVGAKVRGQALAHLRGFIAERRG